MNEAERQKPKICIMAIVSPLLVIFGYSTFVVCSGWLKHIRLLSNLGFCVLIPSVLSGLILGIVADEKIYKSKGRLYGRVFSILGMGLAIVAIASICCVPPLTLW